MTLAVMLSEDENALVCDMAETYHVFDIWALPVSLLAVLASGLRENSRIKMKIAGVNYIPLETVVPQGVDYLRMILKSLIGDKKKEKYLSELLFEKPASNHTVGFHSGEDFLKEWKILTQGVNNG